MHLFIFLALTLAFLCVSVLAQGWDGPIFHIVGNVGNEKYIFNINGAEYENPNLTLIKGQTYQFSIDYINDPAAQVPHPFGFTSTNLTTQATVESFGAIGNIWCKTNFVDAFITTNTSTPCIVNYTANTDAYYQCKFHPHMIGKLTMIDPTNSTSTNGTTPSPTFNGTTFHIIGDRGTDAYIFNVSGVAVENPSFDMVPGQTYQFSIDYLNFPTKGIPHPFGFTTASAGTADVEALGAIGNAKCDTSIPNAFITTDVSKPCIITYVANVNTFYQCAYHPKMRGALTIPSPPTQSPPFNGTTFHIIGDRGTDAYIFNVSGVAVENPSFDLVLGQIYQFSIDYINDPADRINGKPHPFGFASHAVTAPAVEALGAVGNANCKTTFPNTFITTDVSKPCIITYVANINTFYQCSFHRLMRGPLNIIGSTIANSSSSSPTNTTSNNGTTQPTQAPRFTGTTFHIIGDRGRDAYIFNVSGVGVENPSFNLIRGQTYQFSIDYINDPDDKVNGTPHPFGFATPSVRAPAVEALGAIGSANCKTTIPDTFITTDKSKPCIVTYTANVNAFYQCVFHPLMRGALNVIDPVSSSTGGGPTPTSDPRCVAGICINAASSLTTSSSMYLSIIASLIALAVTAF